MVGYKHKITNCHYDTIKRNELYKFIVTEYFNDIYYQNIDFVKQVLKIFLCIQQKNKTVIIILFMLNIDDKFI